MFFREFPAQKKEPPRKQVLDGLAAAVKARPAAPNSTEALLLEWSRKPRDTTHVGRSQSLDEYYLDARDIILRGADAVPDLIALLNDPRITTHEYSSAMNDPARSLLLGELAERLLQQITGTVPPRSGRRSDPAVFRSWLEKSHRLGEEQTLAESVFQWEDGKIKYINGGPPSILARKFPNRLAGLCREFSADAKPETQPFKLAEAVASASLPKEKKVVVLADFARRGSLAQQRSVLQTLAKLDQEKCAEILLPVLRTLSSDSPGPYWTCPEAAFTHVVMLIQDTNSWREYLRAAKRASVGLRMEIMNPMDYTYIGQTNRSLRLAFLAAFLQDESVRDASGGPEKFQGPCAAFTFPKIAVRDLAASLIAVILGFPDNPTELWSDDQWAELRSKVQFRLADEKLPEL